MMAYYPWLRRVLRLPEPEPPKPTREAQCAYCKKTITTTIMDGEVIHLICQHLLNEERKEQQAKEKARREQIELIKIAMRELVLGSTHYGNSTREGREAAHEG